MTSDPALLSALAAAIGAAPGTLTCRRTPAGWVAEHPNLPGRHGDEAMNLLQYALMINEIALDFGPLAPGQVFPPPQAKTPADLRALEAARLKRERRAAKARAGR